MDIKITQPTQKKTKPDLHGADAHKLGFGQYFTDMMFVARYSTKKGWHSAEVKPYEPLMLDPAASVLHYGQALFEGMKAFKRQNGDVVLFRPEFNWKRMCEGAERLCMQAPPKELFIEGIAELVRQEKDWIPTIRGSAIYIRPTLIGSEGYLGVRPSDEYIFFVILSPVSSYYKEGLSPVKIWIEETDSRAAPGGLGATKAAANYASSLRAAHKAKQQGYAQVLWLDTAREYIEEVGTMNVFFVFKNEVVTPLLDGTILKGGVRDTIIDLLKKNGHKVIERKLSIAEVREKAKSGDLVEAFGTGTAAVISPIGELGSLKGNTIIHGQEIGPVTKKLYNQLLDIQLGDSPDTEKWIYKI